MTKEISKAADADRRSWPSQRVLSLVIALLTTHAVCFMMREDLEFQTHCRSTFYNVFFPPGAHDDHQKRATDVYHIYNVSQALERLQNTGSCTAPCDFLDAQPPLAPSKRTLRLQKQKTYMLRREDPLGPFSSSHLNTTATLLRRVHELNLEFRVLTPGRVGYAYKSVLDSGGAAFRTFEWNVHLFWDFAHRGGRIDMYLGASPRPVDTSMPAQSAPDLTVLALGALAVGSLVRAGSFLRPKRVRQILNQLWCHRSPVQFLTWDCARGGQGCAANVVRSDGGFSSDEAWRSEIAVSRSRSRLEAWDDLIAWLEVRHGIHPLRFVAAGGVFLAWICVCDSGSPQGRGATAALWALLAAAMPPVLGFLFSWVPLFLGFSTLGLALFSDHAPAKFGSLARTSATLFSLLNGDVIMETMTDIEEAGALVSRAYVFGFVCVFGFHALNGVLCIIQETLRDVKDPELPAPLIDSNPRLEGCIESRSSWSPSSTRLACSHPHHDKKKLLPKFMEE
eukprot:CAMPEP_0178445086 /NCGR_PEP_ID=MMETSP0689_2-20121128/39945_1 /TAXON_ID=160604 /ORGANISM="Amphidinium massartii, Strain CS-259" /LENGTH=507 /DNA_ID=CAMNT_0020069545 /DNA_START=47 /DNA_END=1571 /DNA_ORIENTATION=-